jgi:hypothetical protein
MLFLRSIGLGSRRYGLLKEFLGDSIVSKRVVTLCDTGYYSYILLVLKIEKFTGSNL